MYFWSFVVALLLFSTGAGLSLYEGVRHLRHPVDMVSPGVNYVVLAIAMLLDGAPWLIAYRHFNRTRGRRGVVDLGVTAIWLALETKGLLIGESANQEVVSEIRRLAQRYPEVERVNEVLTMHMGPDYILANISVDIACNVARSRAHAIMDELDERIKAADPRVKRVFIESQNVC